MFNESGDFDKIMTKRRAFYKRMEDDFEFRMKQVDMKLLILNTGKLPRYVRYKTTVHDTWTNDEYEIGLHGQLKLYNANNTKTY